MARTRNDDKLLDTEVASTESEVVEDETVVETDDAALPEDAVATAVKETSDTTDANDEVADVSVEDDTDSTDASAETDSEAAASATASITADAAESDSTDESDAECTAIKREVKHTNRLMKVYAHANEKSKSHSFIGTYTVTGVVKGKFKQIVCNVPGIGKFTGYLLSR